MMPITNYIRRNITQRFAKKGDRLPDVIIIGVQKAATSSLFAYLSQHSFITPSMTKEIHFFDNDETFNRGLNHYKQQFPFARPDQLVLEATPNYLYHAKVADRIAALDKPIKFICMLRHPLKRARSAWNMYRDMASSTSPSAIKARLTFKRNQSETNTIYQDFVKHDIPSLQSCIKKEMKLIQSGSLSHEPSIIARGFYETQIEYWFSKFSRQQFYFLQQEDFSSDLKTKHKIQEILNFLKIKEDTSFFDNLKLSIKNKRSYPKTKLSILDEQTEEQLMQLFRSKNKNLEVLTGLQIDWLHR